MRILRMSIGRIERPAPYHIGSRSPEGCVDLLAGPDARALERSPPRPRSRPPRGPNPRRAPLADGRSRSEDRAVHDGVLADARRLEQHRVAQVRPPATATPGPSATWRPTSARGSTPSVCTNGAAYTGWPLTRPSIRSTCARRYCSGVPRSSQYASDTNPKTGRPSAISRGKMSRSIEAFSPRGHPSSAAASSTYVPALMSPGTSSDGFSRNSITRPSSPVGTSPNGRASSTCVSGSSRRRHARDASPPSR